MCIRDRQSPPRPGHIPLIDTSARLSGGTGRVSPIRAPPEGLDSRKEAQKADTSESRLRIPNEEKEDHEEAGRFDSEGSPDSKKEGGKELIHLLERQTPISPSDASKTLKDDSPVKMSLIKGMRALNNVEEFAVENQNRDSEEDNLSAGEHLPSKVPRLKGLSHSEDEEGGRRGRLLEDEYYGRNARSDPEGAQEANESVDEYKEQFVDAVTDEIMEMVVVEFIYEFEQFLYADRFGDIDEEKDDDENAHGQEELSQRASPNQFGGAEKYEHNAGAVGSPSKIRVEESHSAEEEPGRDDVISPSQESIQNKSQVPSRGRFIKTSISAVHKYLSELIEMIKGPGLTAFLEQLNTPIGATPEERLKSFHVIDPASAESLQAEFPAPPTPVLSVELFVELENELASRREVEVTEEIQEMERIHNKLIFDAMNEVLDGFRPFGAKGKPVPWRSISSRIFFRRISAENVPGILEKAKEKVMELTISMCGVIPEKEDSILGHELNLDENYVNQVREDYLARMLAREAYENEDKWINYEEEETEVAFDLADLVFEKLISECVEDLLEIQTRREDLARPRSQGGPPKAAIENFSPKSN
eukprot:TRINITY_DN13618_c0_g1_i1.p2 TRINITY_DN13618_c0_g1~~TRINITY_DN13618_c0_g1_i1.p2  ORF type:complete len:590 (+),score=159.81 TRINITY_DN13618_c0_g1_i1:89-1858(+)